MNTQPSDALSQFTDRLLTEKGLTKMDPAVLAELRSDLLERVEQHVSAALVVMLPPTEQEEFNHVLDAADSVATQAFLEAKIPDLPEVIAAALLRFRAVYLSA